MKQKKTFKKKKTAVLTMTKLRYQNRRKTRKRTNKITNKITNNRKIYKLSNKYNLFGGNEIVINPEDLNPPIRLLRLKGAKQFYVIDDSVCLGGTKQRLLSKYLPLFEQKEIIYAGPDTGMAQIALAVGCKAFNKQAIVFLNTYKNANPLPILTQNAIKLGAKIYYTDSPTGRTLKETQEAAQRYYEEDTENRLLLPFGLHSKEGELTFNCFVEALQEVLGKIKEPKRLWCVAGSGFLFSVLHHIFPKTKLMIVQVGKKIWPDQLENMDAKLFIASEKFAENAKEQPPYNTIPWYDAKVWHFVKKYGQDGDYIWNVAGLRKI